MKLSSELLSTIGDGAHELEATNLEDGTILPEGTNPQEVAEVARVQHSAPRAPTRDEDRDGNSGDEPGQGSAMCPTGQWSETGARRQETQETPLLQRENSNVCCRQIAPDPAPTRDSPPARSEAAVT